jgi:hypothetical protein
VLFTLSAAAALVFLRRRRTLQQAKARELMAFRKEEEGTAALAVPTIDTHLHVWASPEEVIVLFSSCLLSLDCNPSFSLYLRTAAARSKDSVVNLKNLT